MMLCRALGVRRVPATHGGAVRALSTSPITPRASGYSQWYLDVVGAAELVDAGTPVRGCVTLRPRGFALWDAVRRDLDARLAALGAQNVYFPLLVPVSLLAREADHVAGFASECAVVTHHRLVAGDGGATLVPDPSARLAEPFAVRPTSEALVWEAFSRWIVSHADLPLRVNQWANVVRWERRTRPFLRSCEFLWQEGHSAHASAEEASTFARSSLAVYAAHLEHALAIPAIAGAKSPSERFAGAEETLTVEAIVQNGWALQAGTSHALGQRFAKCFGVTYLPAPSGGGAAASGGGGGGSVQQQHHPWGTSWGASTRLIGAVLMTHSDDVGALFPPAVAPTQVVVVALAPPPAATAAAASARAKDGGVKAAAPAVSADAIIAHARAVCETLTSSGTFAGQPLRVVLDVDISTPPGARYFAWERKGVPLRIEVGQREVLTHTVSLSERVGCLSPANDATTAAAAAAEKSTSTSSRAPRARRVTASSEPAQLVSHVQAALSTIQGAMLSRARATRDARIRVGGTYEELRAHAAEVSAAVAAAAGVGGDGGDEEPEEGGAHPRVVAAAAAVAAGGGGGGGAHPPSSPPATTRDLVSTASAATLLSHGGGQRIEHVAPGAPPCVRSSDESDSSSSTPPRGHFYMRVEGAMDSSVISYELKKADAKLFCAGGPATHLPRDSVVVDIVRTFVPESARGKGHAAILQRALLEWAQGAGFVLVQASCAYTVGWAPKSAAGEGWSWDAASSILTPLNPPPSPPPPPPSSPFEAAAPPLTASAFLVPWCDDADAEARVKAETRYTLRCFPFDAQAGLGEQRCFFSGRRATHVALFARAF